MARFDGDGETERFDVVLLFSKEVPLAEAIIQNVMMLPGSGYREHHERIEPGSKLLIIEGWQPVAECHVLSVEKKEYNPISTKTLDMDNPDDLDDFLK